MNGNYIKIYRSLLDWGWYKDEHTKSLFIHCLLKANWKEAEFKGIPIKRGQFVTSIPTLQVDLGLTSNEVRTAIKHLKSTGEITVRTYNKFSVFTVVKYDLYQCEPQAEPQTDNTQGTVKSQSINSLLTAIEEGKNNKKEKKESNIAECEPAPVEPIPLNDGTEWICSVDEYNEFERLYPSVDIEQSFRDMRAWSLSNPSKKKTRRGVRRFVNNWLSGNQDCGKRKRTGANKTDRISEVDNW